MKLSGSPIFLVLAAGSRDPNHIPDPDRFDPDRRNLEYLGFGGGAHYCFGAPLARPETQIALTQLTRRLENPRLVSYPPPTGKTRKYAGPATSSSSSTASTQNSDDRQHSIPRI
jgi:cytochrome P450